MVLFGAVAHAMNRPVAKVLVCTFVASFVGGVLALVLLDAEEEDEEEVVVSDPVKNPSRMLREAPTGKRRAELERLLGDGR